MKIFLFNILFLLYISGIYASIFDSVEWEKVYESKGVSVYTQKDKKEEINYYKAEKIVSWKIAEALYNNVLAFDYYPNIFPRTTVFKKVKQLNENKYIMYSQINFKPLKNRDYYIYFEFIKNDKEYSVVWYSVSENDYDSSAQQRNVLRAKNINGRWLISENGNKTKISVELHNDFNFNMPKATLLPYEITSAAEMVEDLVNYTLKNK